MEIVVLIEPMSDNGFRATGAGLGALTAEGATRDEALQNLRLLVQERIAQGAEVTALQVTTPSSHPLASSAGIFRPDDSAVQDWLQIMAENRRIADDNPDVP
jgi:hypothetical protein